MSNDEFLSGLPRSRVNRGIAEFDFMEPTVIQSAYQEDLLAPEARSSDHVNARDFSKRGRLISHWLPVCTVDGEIVRVHVLEFVPKKPKPGTVLWIPGGFGVARPDVVAYGAGETGCRWFAVDWLGRGLSDEVPGKDPSPALGAVYFQGESWRDSYQYFNTMALLQVLGWVSGRKQDDGSPLILAGTSWGSFYSFFLAGIDQRMDFLVSSFGTGFLDLDTRYVWHHAFDAIGSQLTRDWIRAFDPGRRAHLIRCPVFFETAANDKFFSIPSAMATISRLVGQRSICIHENQDHFLKPYSGQYLKVMEEIVRSNQLPVLPRMHDLQIADDGLSILARIDLPSGKTAADCRVDLTYSVDGDVSSFSRYWHRQPMTLQDDQSSWSCPVPTVNGVLNAYARLEMDGYCISSMVFETKLGVPDGSCAEGNLVLSFQVPDVPLDRQPVGDRIYPSVSLVPVGRAVEFAGQEGAKAYHLEYSGTQQGLAAIYSIALTDIPSTGFADGQLVLDWRLSESALVSGGMVGLIADYHAHDQAFIGVEISTITDVSGSWHRSVIDIAAMTDCRTRPEPNRVGKATPFDHRRICGVAFLMPKTTKPTWLEVAAFTLKADVAVAGTRERP